MQIYKSTVAFFKNKPVIINCFRVLVVDDYSPAKQLLAASLSSFPQIGEIDYASSGEEALGKVSNSKYDIIFLDVTMPGLDGFETCARIRDIKGYGMTPIIMVTGNNAPGNSFKGTISGCSGYVTKPIQQESFRKLNLRLFSWLEDYKTA